MSLAAGPRAAGRTGLLNCAELTTGLAQKASSVAPGDRLVPAGARIYFANTPTRSFSAHFRCAFRSALVAPQAA